MQSPFNDKLDYSYPCKTSEACIDYEDYDVCESNEDITEKDLAVLLKEEAAKLEKDKAQRAESQNEKNDKEQRAESQNGKNDKAQRAESQNEKKEKAQRAESQNDKKEKAQRAESQNDKKEKAQRAESQNDKKAEPSSDPADKEKQANVGGFKEEDENGPNKKSCKYIKNPFFTNRLKLSTSHLPLPPPGPPPQNFPLATEESITKICPKKKKCRKDDKNKTPTYKKGEISEVGEIGEVGELGEVGEVGEIGQISQMGQMGQMGERDEMGEVYDVGEIGDEDEKRFYKKNEDIRHDGGVSKGEFKGNRKELKKSSERKDSDLKLKKTHCKKTTDKLPICKKKESEESITFQMRKIPLQQKDLPQTSPKNIPEVERQILMACGKHEEKDCKKKCKKKDKVT